jgi:hypothetical protein
MPFPLPLDGDLSYYDERFAEVYDLDDPLPPLSEGGRYLYALVYEQCGETKVTSLYNDPGFGLRFRSRYIDESGYRYVEGRSVPYEIEDGGEVVSGHHYIEGKSVPNTATILREVVVVVPRFKAKNVDLVKLIDSNNALMLANSCEVFVLSNGEAAERVVFSLKEALAGDHQFKFVDCFLKDGRQRVASLRRVEYDEVIENLSAELRQEQAAMNRLYEQGFRWTGNF